MQPRVRPFLKEMLSNYDGFHSRFRASELLDLRLSEADDQKQFNIRRIKMVSHNQLRCQVTEK